MQLCILSTRGVTSWRKMLQVAAVVTAGQSVAQTKTLPYFWNQRILPVLGTVQVTPEGRFGGGSLGLPLLSVPASFERNTEMVSLMIDGIRYWYRPILAIILYRCNYGKWSEMHRNAIIVAHTCSLTVTHIALRWCSKRDYGMYLPGLWIQTQPCD